MRFLNFKKTISIILAGLIIYSPLSVLFYENVFAQSALNLPGLPNTQGLPGRNLPTPAADNSGILGDATKNIIGQSVPTNDKNSKNIFWDNVLKFGLKLSGQLLKKVLLDRMVDAVIAWINRDGQGSIISDWDKFINQAGQDAVGEVAKSLGAGFLCGPINFQVNLALVDPGPFSQQASCTLDQITGNIDAFVENMENGGFIAYQAQMEPQNNYYGAVLMAWDEANTQRAKAERAAQSEAIAGQGFLSQQVCDGPKGECRTVTPGTYVGDFVKQAYIKTPFDSLIAADDIAKYVTAIANAAINRLTKHGVEGLQGVFKRKTSEYTTTTASNPCEGLTGDAFLACQARVSSGQRNFEFSRDTVLSDIYGTYTPMLQATSLLSETVGAQSEYVAALEQLASCKPNETNQAALLSEQTVLDDLQARYEDSQTFLAPLEERIVSINSQTGEDGYDTLMSDATSVESLLDPQNASNFLDLTQSETQAIRDSISAQLPGVQAQLIGCSTQ